MEKEFNYTEKLILSYAFILHLLLKKHPELVMSMSSEIKIDNGGLKKIVMKEQNAKKDLYDLNIDEHNKHRKFLAAQQAITGTPEYCHLKQSKSPD